ncbi:MBL fold metallo-hydrolase [Halocatena halophila]|uniref:MBL fold metallo-hydrolase n=1 Tax=Halocatena halophila TaxID=2814576 RepID=UPI002ED4590F
MEVISLSNAEFEGENSVYLLRGNDSVALIDTAIETPETERRLREQLAEYGVALSEIDSIVVTHWHQDHAGLAGVLQRESNATVYVHEADAPLVAQEDGPTDALFERQRQQFTSWGIPEDRRAALLDRLAGTAATTTVAPSVTPVADGDQLTVAGTELTVIHAPGHTAGQCCFAFTAEDGSTQAFVGDAILGQYTPNVGGADVRVEHPLDQYLATLSRIIDQEFAVAWPGHRDAITVPSDRARTIYEHHVERATRVATVVAEHGPMNAWEVSAELFGSLEGIHVMHGPGEAYSHLDHLARHGRLSESDGVYQFDSDGPAVKELFSIP